jgi:GTP cyclohydrolase I
MINNKVEEIKAHVDEIMSILEIEKYEGNRETPLRIAKMYTNELFANRNDYNIEDLKATMKYFDNSESSEEMVIVKDIDVTSMCEHHWLPFIGKADIAYVPDKKLVGLSKIPRAVKFFSKKPQIQERLVKEIGDFLVENIEPKALFIRMDAVHQCMACRGAETGASTETTWRYDRTNQNYYREFLARV